MAITILVVEDEENARKFYSDSLLAFGYEVIGTPSFSEAQNHIRRGDADVAIVDVTLPDGYGPNLLYETAHLPFRPPMIFITAYGDIDMAVEAMKNGAHDFLPKPFEIPRLEQSLQRACEIVTMRRELAHLRQTQQQKGLFVVGKSPEMQTVLSRANRIASATVSVLITGETGTGKDVLARHIHNISPRANKPFIAINCAAIQNTMLESELFGYEAGAFTGAQQRKHGLMEVADGGILFLDEIASMPVEIQAKLLRASEEQAIRRVGGTNMINVDVQILAASNRDLKLMIEEGKFREDLYYRLKVVDLHLPPLRDRKMDIAELVAFFVRQNNARRGLNITDITPRAMQSLLDYHWPGNIRELSNAIDHAMLFCDGAVIDIPYLPKDVTLGS